MNLPKLVRLGELPFLHMFQLVHLGILSCPVPVDKTKVGPRLKGLLVFSESHHKSFNFVKKRGNNESIEKVV